MLKLVHVELAEANKFVETLHRHHGKVVQHRFSIGVINEKDTLVGVAIIGKPKARAIDQKNIVEVNRLCTDGTKNACSFFTEQRPEPQKNLDINK